MILYLRLSEAMVAVLLQRIYRFTFRFITILCKFKFKDVKKGTFIIHRGKIIISHVIKSNFVILNATQGKRYTDRYRFNMLCTTAHCSSQLGFVHFKICVLFSR